MAKLAIGEDGDDGSTRTVLTVGQDERGHWLVQENHGLMEGHFTSFSAALAYARAERPGFPHASVAVATGPLRPYVAFGAARVC